MLNKTPIPQEFMPFVLYLSKVTPDFVSFSIPNTEENYYSFMKLIEPFLHPNIVEIQHPTSGTEDILIRIMIKKLASNLGQYIKPHSGQLYTFDSASALKEAQDIINRV